MIHVHWKCVSVCAQQTILESWSSCSGCVYAQKKTLYCIMLKHIKIFFESESTEICACPEMLLQLLIISRLVYTEKWVVRVILSNFLVYSAAYTRTHDVRREFIRSLVYRCTIVNPSACLCTTTCNKQPAIFLLVRGRL